MIEAVLSQTLVTRLEGGRIAAFEIMVATTATRNLIRENKVHQISSVIESNSQNGMQTLNQGLADLVKKNIIAEEVAIQKVQNLKSFEQWLKSTIKL